MRRSLILLIAVVCAGWPGRAVGAQQANACVSAGTATNTVIRFYLAVDRRQFAAAYSCLAPVQQARWPFGSWVRGYAHTTRTRLLLADSQVPNGERVTSVAIRLYTADAVSGGSQGRLFAGTWHIDTQGRPAGATVRQVKGGNLRPRAILTQAGRAILDHSRKDVTGDGVADELYLTSGAGCGSCHAQQIWIYSSGKLIFQQQVDDAAVVVARNHAGMEITTDTPGSPGLDSCCPSKKTHERWAWTAYGFALRSTWVTKTRSRF